VTACPSDDALAAFVGRSSTDRDGISTHIDECDSCRAIVIAAVRAGVATPVTEVDGPVNGASRARFQIGAKIGRYDVRALIGGGGMGHVYECYDRELDRAVALKVLRPELRGSAAILAERLIRESRMMAKVTHPSVIAVHDIGREGDFVYIAMALIRGTTLGEFARGKPWRDVLALYERAGEGLAAAHKAGIVHRDFKPDNVLIEIETERVVVTDFGIARAASDGDAPTGTPRTGDIQLTTTGAAIGTPAYMAPEQLAGKPADVRADVFAFSVSLWESLFGERPFPGTTVKAIEAAMQQPPVARGEVPKRIVRVLERGLAIDPAERWPEMPVMLRELAIASAGSRKLWIAAGAVGVVLAGAVAVVVLSRPVASANPCEAALVKFADSYDPIALHALVGGDPDVATRTLGKASAIASAWHTTHGATCAAERSPPQQPAIAACLEARRLELAGFVDDTRADGPAFAIAQVKTIGDPAGCAKGAPSLASPNVPEDATLRRQVTAVRNRMTEARVLGERNELAKANFPKLVADSKIWPRVHAEALYLLGMAQAQAGESKLAQATYREAAAIAQQAHHDQIAADAWIELTAMATFDDGDATRGLEYLTYAEAALDRLGRPVELEAQLAYVKGTTLIEANRVGDAEASLRRAVELGETTLPDTLPQAIQGLGYLYERQGRYADAVAAYRRALAKLAALGQADSANDAVMRTRLALNLGLIGEGARGEIEARRALALAERLFAPDSPDRNTARETLAHVLHAIGKHDEALALARTTKDEVAKAQGDRSKHYADLMLLEGEILDGLGRFAEAEKAFDRACDILAFESGAESTPVAQCRVSQARSLAGLGNKADALAVVDHAVPVLFAAYGQAHPLLANALVTRGIIHAELGHRTLAVDDLEKAISILERATFDPGLLGSAQFALGKQRGDRTLVETAIGRLAAAPGTWKATHTAAVSWLARR
jgi:tetratricopeptide (TPR) repeat protein/predicted Ser/Thr protein kinase